jgi:uncharacterized membrane protein
MPFSLKPPAAAVGFYRRVTSSLWLTPALYVLGGIMLASLVVWIGPHLPELALRLFSASESATVKSALQLLASSTLTVATVTFSILIVVLTMTAANFSPRALSGFMRDSVDQNTLGIFLGAFAFGAASILLLRPTPYDDRFYGLVLLVTMTIAFLVLCALVYFIHHTATAVQVTNLVVRLHREADEALTQFLGSAEGEKEKSTAPAMLPSEPSGTVDARTAGYIQVLDRDRLFALADAHGLVVRVRRHTGNFATRGITLCEIWPAESLTPELSDEFRAAYAVGAQRTAERDPLLGMELLAEIALRALSPGINDPNTAVNCLDYLGDLLVRIAGQELPQHEVYDESGRLCIVYAAPDFRDFLERSLLGIAGASAGHARVVLTLLRVLRDVASVTQSRARCRTVETTARAIADRALRELAFEREREQVRGAMGKVDAVWAEPYGDTRTRSRDGDPEAVAIGAGQDAGDWEA